MKKLMTVVTLALLSSGCAQTKLSTPGGLQFSTTRFLWQGKIGTVEVGTNGTVKLIGYSSEAAQVVEAAATGVAKGLAQSMKP